jgi:8-oxo-dGTP pyrophosphatase MutT (NUDIX family)
MSLRKTTPILRIFDEAKAKEFYVEFLGFTVDWEHHFGKRAEDALRRELREEIGAEIDDVRLISVIENFFALEGANAKESKCVFLRAATVCSVAAVDVAP